ncbi:M20/M25/M40 family metallo-hydrolase [Clostridiaceae bacterium Marseille-Q4143]|nr:M20/M25/M40 family metallo-hydrolase [Clostridiaceae bacterium Marseille-Q4143]
MLKKEDIVSAAKEGAFQYADEQLDILKRFAAIDCGSQDEEGNEKVVAIINELLEQIEGIEIEKRYYPGYGTNIIARLTPEQSEGKIILNAHMDTVFHREDAAKHPFHIDGDTAYGLGIADCKGGILVAIYAVLIMQKNQMLPNKEIVFIFNCDEEIGSPTGHQVFDTEIEGTEMAFVFEPARQENGILTSRKGGISFTIEVTGKKAHAGVNYLEGRSATVELADKILKFYKNNDNERGIQFNVGMLNGGKDGVGVVADYASADMAVRIFSKSDENKVNEIISKVIQDTYIDGTKTTVRINRVYVPMERTKDNVKLYEMVRDAGRLLGYELPEQTSGGGGDASYFSYKGIPTVDALGPYMYTIHDTNESLRISSIEEKTCLFCVVLAMINK